MTLYEYPPAGAFGRIIPKEKIFDCMAAIREAVAQAPVHIGDVVVENVCGTGVDVVATKDAE